MRRHRLRPGDDAVSPVVGVVLLVGIAVVLMGTIGTFVLGFGPGEQAPNGNIQFAQEEGTTTNVTVTVAWSEGLHRQDVEIIVGSDPVCSVASRPWSGSGTLDEGDEVTITGYGSACTYPPTGSTSELQANDTVRVVWSPEGSSRTEVLEEHEVF